MDLRNLNEIFEDGTLFRIPEYQRGYSWKKEQLNDLWSDIEILQNDKKHYTGVLSVVPEGNIVHVVDGQQRITTLIILIQVICDAVPGKRINGKEQAAYVARYLHKKAGKQSQLTEVIFEYEKGNSSHTYFKTKILELKDTENVAQDTLYTKNLDDAKRFFIGKIERLNFKELEQLLEKVTTRLVFNYYELNTKLNAFVAYETTNNRGKPLSNLELLKNRLMYLNTLLPNNDKGEREGLRNDINNAWKTIYEFLGKVPKKPLPDDDFLRDHWIMYFEYGGRRQSEVYKKFLLDEYFTAKDVSHKKRTFFNGMGVDP